MDLNREPSLFYSVLTRHMNIATQDVDDIIDLHAELSPNAPRILRLDVLSVLREGYIVIGRDPVTERIVAMATIMPMRTLRGTHGYVHDVVIASVYRGKGHGRPLLKETIHFAGQQRLGRLELTSGNAREAALHVYESVGFIRKDTNVLTFTFTP